MITKDALDIESELEKVTKDNELRQPEQFRTKIERTVHKSYKVNTNWALLTTIASFLMFLYNMANWELTDKRPMLCDFLEKISFHLTSEAERTWLRTNQHIKQLLLAIISQIQKVVVYLVLAASDDDNHPNDNNPGLTTSFRDGEDSDLAMVKRLITYFEKDLLKAIEQQKLNNFDKITPIFRKVYPDDIPSPATVSTLPQKGAMVNQKTVRVAATAEAKAVAAAMAAARSDNTRCPNSNDRYGPRYQSNTFGNQ